MTVRNNHVYPLLLAGMCLGNSGASWAGEPPDVTAPAAGGRTDPVKETLRM